MTLKPGFFQVTITTSVIDFDIDFVAGNSIVATVNSIALAPVLFSVDQATTIAAVAVQIGTATGVSTSIVTGARQITVVFSPNVNFTDTVNSVITTGGISQPTATIVETAPFKTDFSIDNLTFDAGTTLLNSNGQLWIGSSSGNPVPATLSASNGITVANGSNSIALSFAPANVRDPITTVNFGMSTYAVLPTDYVILTDATGGAIILHFPDLPSAGDSWVVKDNGSASGFNTITITTPGGAAKFDAGTSLTINSAFGSFEFFTNGTDYFTI